MKLLFAVIYNLVLLWGFTYLDYRVALVGANGQLLPEWWALPLFITELIAGIIGFIWTIIGLATALE
jgi:hypothetical protein